VARRSPVERQFEAVLRRSHVLLSLCLTACGYVGSDGAEAIGRCTITDFKTDGSIAAKWNGETRTLAYSRANAAGYFQVYLSDEHGEHERALTYSAWAEDRNKYALEWHPSGRYLFVEVEKPTHPGSSNDAIPGYGAYTDLWLITADGKSAWMLVELPNDYDHAITHGAITPDGTRFTYTERVKAPAFLDANLAAGGYVFNVADFVDGSTPRLANTHAYRPAEVDQGGEVDGISADGETIAFYSTYVTKSLFATRIYSMNLETGQVTELSKESFSQAPQYTPDGQKLVYMSGQDADIFPGEIQGADWWVVDRDGKQRKRLTAMNVKGSPQSNGKRLLAGTVQFDSATSFYGDVLTEVFGLTGKIVKVECPLLANFPDE
jgi:Tol biopolymer transport system component